MTGPVVIDHMACGDGLEIDGMILDFISRSNVNETKDNEGNVIGVEQSIVGADIGLNVYQPGAATESCASSSDMTSPSSTGCWSFDSDLFQADAFIIVLKAANSPGWAAWLFDGASAASDFGAGQSHGLRTAPHVL